MINLKQQNKEGWSVMSWDTNLIWAATFSGYDSTTTISIATSWT